MSKDSAKDQPMATLPISPASKAELRLQQYRRVRATISRQTKGSSKQLRKEDKAILKSFRKEREAANALIDDER